METNYSSQDLGHLGLVAGMCNELKISSFIDSRIPPNGKEVSHGTALCAMILNGLGFTNQRLYLIPQFFQNKPVERLLGSGITADMLNDDSLGRTLDAIYRYGPSEIFSELAAHTAVELGLSSKFCHIDSTSMHVDGVYNSKEDPPDKVIHIVPGYSRDHRPELNQIIINLIVESEGSIPIHMNTASGNSSDKTDFREILRSHVDKLKNSSNVEYVIADSALYSAETLQTLDNLIYFISRVPETIKDTKVLIENLDLEEMTPIDGNYRYAELCSLYGETKQRWIVIHSKYAAKREVESLEKKFLKKSSKEQNAFVKLSKQEFACEADALKAFNKFEKKLKYTQVHSLEVIEKAGYLKRGKPKKGAKPDKYTYQLTGAVASSLEYRDSLAKSKGFFILATNELDSKKLTPEEIFFAYKDQSKVERGFRFLKSPEFLASSLFLKKPERIMALAMVMTVCLMVYTALEFRIRQGLEVENQTFPNQLNKEVKNPTARWVFSCFVGIHVLILPQAPPLVLNLNEQHTKIVALLGYDRFYS